MARGTRDARSLLAAVGLHAAAFFAIGIWASRHPRAVELASYRSVRSSAPDAGEFDVDWAASEPVPALAPTLPQPTDGARRSTPTPLQHGRAVSRAALPEPGGLDAAKRAPSGSSNDIAEEAPESATAPVHPVDLGLGADGWQRWLPATQADARSTSRQPARPLFHLPQASLNGGLREGLEARDRAVGLGSSGPVVSALFNAAHGEHAPATGLARFQITVLQSGAVEISLRDATSELGGWRAVAADAASRLRHAPPRVPHGRKGVRLQIELNAEYSLPNGLKQKDLASPHFEVSGVKLRSTSEAQQRLKDLNPVTAQTGASAGVTPAITDVPGVFIAQIGKVCGYRVGLTLLGPMLQGGCDPSNIGAKPQRMVHTKVLDEAPF